MIGAIENAIEARLRAASDAGLLGYKYRTLETYPDNWDEYLTGQSALPAPGAWITFAGWRPIAAQPSFPRIMLQFGLVVMAENARNERATRQGDPFDPAKPGSYQMIEDAIALLAGQDLGLDIGALAIGSLSFVGRIAALKDRRVSMLALELRTEVGLAAVPPGALVDADVGDFRIFHANWDLPPFGNVDADPASSGVQLPADATADATDHVILEQDA